MRNITHAAHAAPAVTITQAEAAALASHLKYSAQMCDLLDALYPGLRALGSVHAPQTHSLSKEARLSANLALGRLFEKCQVARDQMMAGVSA